MEITVLRKKLHDYIDALPVQGLEALIPLLSFLADDYWKPVIEPASPEECAMIAEEMKEYEKHPETFTDWEDVKKELGLN